MTSECCGERVHAVLCNSGSEGRIAIGWLIPVGISKDCMAEVCLGRLCC